MWLIPGSDGRRDYSVSALSARYLANNRETNEEQKLTIMLSQNFMPCAQSFTRVTIYFLFVLLVPRETVRSADHFLIYDPFQFVLRY